jgi:hypothetical protein
MGKSKYDKYLDINHEAERRQLRDENLKTKSFYKFSKKRAPNQSYTSKYTKYVDKHGKARIAGRNLCGNLTKVKYSFVEPISCREFIKNKRN